MPERSPKQNSKPGRLRRSSPVIALRHQDFVSHIQNKIKLITICSSSVITLFLPLIFLEFVFVGDFLFPNSDLVFSNFGLLNRSGDYKVITG